MRSSPGNASLRMPPRGGGTSRGELFGCLVLFSFVFGLGLAFALAWFLFPFFFVFLFLCFLLF